MNMNVSRYFGGRDPASPIMVLLLRATSELLFLVTCGVYEREGDVLGAISGRPTK